MVSMVIDFLPSSFLLDFRISDIRVDLPFLKQHVTVGEVTLRDAVAAHDASPRVD
jgi:hypothetical protein